MRELARFIAAELACNAWSDHLDITLAGLDANLCDLNPARVHIAANPNRAMADHVEHAHTARRVAAAFDTDLLSGRLRLIAADTWMPTVLIAESDELLAALADDHTVWTGAARHPCAILAVDPGNQAAELTAGMTAHIDTHGTLRITSPGSGAHRIRTTAQQIRPLAQLLAHATDTRR